MLERFHFLTPTSSSLLCFPGARGSAAGNGCVARMFERKFLKGVVVFADADTRFLMGI
jgi:predicted aconitase with swiveling domain